MNSKKRAIAGSVVMLILFQLSVIAWDVSLPVRVKGSESQKESALQCTASAEAKQAAARSERIIEEKIVCLREGQSGDGAEEEEAAGLDMIVGLDMAADGDSFLSLLEDDSLSEYTAMGFIPVNLGAGEDEADESSSDESGISDETSLLPTREDLIEEKYDLLTPDEDLPSSLTYVYNPDMCLDLTEEEITVLEKIVQAEAGDQDIYGRMLVANVVINRVNSRYFPDSVKEVVFQKSQFSPVWNGRYSKAQATSVTREAVARVLSGEDYSQGALYFFMRSATSKSRATWFDSQLHYLFKYGCHEFFTEK